MVFPSTQLVAFFLLLVSIVCWGLWPLTYKSAGPNYRFEVFSFDFAIGAVLLALLAAYTFGTLGSELNFSDTMLVAGRRSQLLAFCAGAMFAVGNMLLVCTISLIGLSRAALLTSSLAGALIGGLAVTRANYTSAFPAICLFLMVMLLTALSSQTGTASSPRRAAMTADIKGAPVPRPYGYSSGGWHPNRQPLTASTKGVITGAISGLMLGSVLPVMRLAQTEVLAIGPYGGVLMACLGLLVATPFLNFYFMNLAIKGESLSLRAYLRGHVRQRILGAAGGVFWAAGALALYVAITAPTVVISRMFGWGAPLAAVLVTVICGFAGFKDEPQYSGPSRKLVYGACLLFVCAAVLFLAAQARTISS